MKSPFCKVCFDTGKPESLYTSHYVNDVPGKKGVVVCPTLLALECRYCKQTGHTVSRCNMITEARKKQFARNRQLQQVQVKPRTNINRYSALENEEMVLSVPKATVLVTTYASVVVAPPVVLPPLRIFIPRSPSTSPPPLKKLNWADCTSDSDDSDE
jgi:hypothetical protein